MTALKAGCLQQPPDGTLLGLTGSVFTTTAVNFRDPAKDAAGSSGSGSLSASAITGIVIGVLLIFVLAISLLIVHFRRERAFHQWQQAQYYDTYGLPDAFDAFQHGDRGEAAALSQAYRRCNARNPFGGEKGSVYAVSRGQGRRHAHARMQSRAPRTQSLSRSSITAAQNDEEAVPRGRSLCRSLSLPACRSSSWIRAPSRTRSRTHSPSRSPVKTSAPPTHPYQNIRCHSTDSFAREAYEYAAAQSARIASQRASQKAPPPTNNTPSAKPPKRRLRKLYSPLKRLADWASSRNNHGMVISAPIMTNGPPGFRLIPIPARPPPGCCSRPGLPGPTAAPYGSSGKTTPVY